MTKADLYRRYADMIEMCEGTNISPFMCVLKYHQKPMDSGSPQPVL